MFNIITFVKLSQLSYHTSSKHLDKTSIIPLSSPFNFFVMFKITPLQKKSICLIENLYKKCVNSRGLTPFDTRYLYG